MFGFSSFDEWGAADEPDDPLPDHYGVLGISEAASSEEVRAAYRSSALRTHPDKGGDTSVFAAVQSAHEVLSDPDKRTEYDRDRRGAAHVASGSVRGGVVVVKVTLDSLYSNSWHTVSYTPRGSREPMRTLRVCVPAGSAHGARITVRLGEDADDVVVVVVEHIDSPGFVVDGRDVHMRATVSLANAVGGAPFAVRRPDGLQLTVHQPTGDVIQPGTCWSVASHGLPPCGSDHLAGSLCIHISVYLPREVCPRQADGVRELFSKDTEDLSDRECFTMERVTDAPSQGDLHSTRRPGQAQQGCPVQ